jgi:lipase maturation factor 1
MSATVSLLTASARAWQRFARSLEDGLRFGRDGKPSSFVLSRFLFLRLLGLVYLAAFVSLWVQIKRLIGSHGILPVEDFLVAVTRQLPSPERFYLKPTLCWLNPSDAFLTGLCAGGVLFSCLLIVGLAPVPVLFFLWVFYLSLTIAGQDFLSFQWDILLLETGFLAMFYAPLEVRPRLRQAASASRAVLQLLRLLLFRLVFGSGIVKLTSGDPTWRNLTALAYHYETQPLPVWTSWVMHQLPPWFHQGEVLLTFLFEIGVPLLVFGSRRCRHLACAAIAAFQLLIAATGNYGFFNFLAIVLCVPLLDDDLFPSRLRAYLTPAVLTTPSTAGKILRGGLVVGVVAGVLIVNIVPLLAQRGFLDRAPRSLLKTYQVMTAFRSINTYGLFRVMTTERHEIIVEGSNDGKDWLPYEFRWKPGDPERRPAFTGLHMPRLDWQMWFAALDGYENHAWFIHFLAQLLRGAPEVLDLLQRNPFPDRPPRYIRAVVYDYHFTDVATWKKTGAWWRRERLGLYLPRPLTLRGAGNRP